MLKAKAEEAIAQFESEMINFLQENPECQSTDKKENPILQYVGADYKTTIRWLTDKPRQMNRNKNG